MGLYQKSGIGMVYSSILAGLIVKSPHLASGGLYVIRMLAVTLGHEDIHIYIYIYIYVYIFMSEGDSEHPDDIEAAGC